MRKKVSYKGIVDQGRSTGFKKKNFESNDGGLVRIRVQVRCIRARLMVYADEEKAGLKIGDFIRRDKRMNFDRYKSSDGLTTLIFKKEV
jgi:hypothetical protein